VLQFKVEFLIQPLLFKAGITTVFAEPGLGKSVLFQNIILKLLRDNIVNRVFYIFPDEDYASSVLKILLTEFKDRFLIISPDTSFRRKLQKDIKEGVFGEGDLFVWDSLDSYAEVLSVDLFRATGSLFADFKALKRLGCSCLILHHPNKMGQYAGKVTIKAQSDALFSMQSLGKYKWELIAEKHRGREVLSGYTDCFVSIENGELQIITDFVTGDDEYVVMSILDELSAGDKKQYEIIKALKEKDISKHKTLRVLDRYDGRFWTSRRGEKNSLIYSKNVNIVVEQEEDRGAGCVSSFDEFSVEPEEREPTEQEKKIIEKLENYVFSCISNGREGAGVKEAIEEVAKDLTKESLTEDERERIESLRKKKRLKKNEKKEKEELEKKFSSLYEFHLSEVSRVLNLFLDKTKLKKDGSWLKINEEKEIEELANEYDF